jgi:glycosyltransferase involved in cell wall biosynthesis
MVNGNITYILKHELGGITSMIGNVIRYRGEDALYQEIIFIDDASSFNSRFSGSLVDGVHQKLFNFSSKNNWYHSFEGLSKLLPKGNGIIVSNDVHDLLMLSRFNTGKKVVQIVHDAYNVNLALQYHDVVDAFICHSHFYFEVLCQLLSYRRNDIYHVPYGIPITTLSRVQNFSNPLRCLFLGRLSKNKGVYDLYEIDDRLRAANIEVEWTLMGRGPESDNLMEQWKSKVNVEFVSPESNSDVLKICAKNDVLVFPTKFEGFPVAMVESMSVGCVPIVSNLPGGIRELVTQDTGYLCELNNIDQFADNIAYLHQHRPELERLSFNSKATIHKNYNAVNQSPKFQNIFKKILFSENAPRHHQISKSIGSRLDKAWIPNFVTKRVRNL